MPGRYPMAERVAPLLASNAETCVHCAAPIAVTSGWDRWNGFLVECPDCHAFHGRSWHPRAVIFGSFFLNVLSFFFTMQPVRAAIVAVAWIAFMFVALPLATQGPDWLEATAFSVAFLGPAVVNAALLVRHQIDRDRAPVVQRDAWPSR